MRRIIGVEYKHPITTAYLRVVGRTPLSADQAAKKLCTLLQEVLPEAIVLPPRSVGFDHDKRVFLCEVAAVVGHLPHAKATIGRLLLSDLPV